MRPGSEAERELKPCGLNRTDAHGGSAEPGVQDALGTALKYLLK